MKDFKLIEIVGAIASISALAIAYIQWQGDDQIKTIIFSITGVFFVLVVFFAHRAKNKDTNTKFNKIYDVLSDEIYVKAIFAYKKNFTGPRQNKHIYKVNYPRIFKNLPNLTIDYIKGKINYEVIEEKNEYFKIKVMGPSKPPWGRIKLMWTAKGKFID
ncbi:MAG: hypothetical protein GXO85_09890 [Chlorobi bacterium]|nr:hypothetical protein [Chlorobiota bacterium]